MSRIQTRTTVFQIPRPPMLPKTPNTSQADRMLQLQRFAKMPIAVQKVSIFMILLPFIVMAVIGAGVFFAVRNAGGIKAAVRMTDAMMWAGHPPALVDIDGDGVRDLIGIARYVQSGDRAHFAAYSGKTGAQLWESETIGTYSNISQDRFTALGSTLYVATSDGKLVGRDLKVGGAVKWQTQLGEKIQAMCGNGGQLSLATADQKWWVIDDAGTKREGKPLLVLEREYTKEGTREKFASVAGENTDVCMSLGYDHRSPPGLLALRAWGDVANIDGMRLEMLVRLPGGPTIIVGKKSPGTAVPMLARLGETPTTHERPPDPKHRRHRTPKELLPGAAWKVAIPFVDPLNARMDEKHVALTDKAVFVLYEVSSSKHRLAAFDVGSGKRLWDREIMHDHGFVPVSLAVTGDVITLTTWHALSAFATADGSDRWRVGMAD